MDGDCEGGDGSLDAAVLVLHSWAEGVPTVVGVAHPWDVGCTLWRGEMVFVYLLLGCEVSIEEVKKGVKVVQCT